MDNQTELKPDLLHVFIMTGDSVVYDDKATSVSSRNENGRFDILPFHSNFISIIKEFVLIKKTSTEKKELVIKNGILRVFENNVQIFVGSDE